MEAQFQKDFSYKKKAVLLIIAFAIIRGVFAFTMALGVDESYYWAYSQYLKWNYFDHPPMVSIFIRLSTLNLSLDSIEGFVRLSSVLGCGLSSWFLFKTCELLHSSKSGFYAVCMYNASFYAAITAGLFIMPDTPQMVFFTFSFLMIAKIDKEPASWLYWILFGLASGLCIMSKVHGVFVWVGMGLYILLKKRDWLKLPQLYGALVIAVAIACPILIWNIKHDFATYKFHSERVSINKDPINMVSFLGEFASQFIFNNPFNVILACSALLAYGKFKEMRTRPLSIYNFIALPLAILLLVISLFRDNTLPHWSGPAYVALIPLAAIHIATAAKASSMRLLKIGLAGFTIILIGWKSAIHFYGHNFGEEIPKELLAPSKTFQAKNLLHAFDGFMRMQLVTEPLHGWSEAKEKFDSIYRKDIADGITLPNSPLVTHTWGGAQVEYYFSNPGNLKMIGLGSLKDLHEYIWMNDSRKDKVDFTNAYFISLEKTDPASSFELYYNKVDSVTTFIINRNTRPDLKFYIYRLSGWKNNCPVAH